MKAEIKYILCSETDPEIFVPEDSDDFSLYLQLIVGPADEPGEESFGVMVCSPRWAARDIESNGPMVGRHHILANRYDYAELRSFLAELIESQTASTWSELGERIGRIGFWEFEDYVPYQEP